jgi:bifunctional non-homologous end joining protein LigD
MVEGAKPSEMPGFIKPQLATLRSKAPKGEQWLHEIKFDGYRLQVHLHEGRVTITCRRRARLTAHEKVTRKMIVPDRY